MSDLTAIGASPTTHATALFRLLHDRATAELLADRGSRAGWATSVCNGSLPLGTAGLLDGYEAASHWYTRDLLARYGPIRKAERVVIDRNRVTGAARPRASTSG